MTCAGIVVDCWSGSNNNKIQSMKTPVQITGDEEMRQGVKSVEVRDSPITTPQKKCISHY